ncbi:30S ribosomal protein S4 [candidate division WWE3 bacterium CG_4_9_14_0_2_um_filter_35_11]|uniref:Small ribosomal subunit protein uS4 n=1 Tax=candidate division WWE3 bacterium CG_4_9_14_0_2_um_filter_35_11 TaxID=1975077 RepID=A0A2M8EKX6_UNCKA|nr:MAG: 30S ribosomal protein S4 [candidate division WWE3 bacterium CG10_big_fil_rev_8_21_14_0_10_35_32]PJC23350.1 MAG: 30S ribosomal protein S4 [candidate division WWE3 bacterium CG_4_9_14_0_2_um_filter_35_11]
MARYTGPKCRLCRREGVKLFLKGSRCATEKCAVSKRAQIPGQHFRGRSRLSDYGKHLREKQKVKRIYGLLEAQFRTYYEKAAKNKGVTGYIFLRQLESRLDSVVFLSAFAPSRQSARQLIRHKKIMVNGNVVNLPAYQVSVNDKISYVSLDAKPQEESSFPAWIEWNAKERNVNVVRLPEREDIGYEIDEQLIVEYYSR